MTINEYQKLALRTQDPIKPYRNPEAVTMAFVKLGAITDPENNLSAVRLLEGLMGLNGEAGEAMDILKKFLFQGHKLDREHVALELGDICWYLALAADAIGYDLESILNLNLEKIKKRYPDGFKFDRSIKRREDDV